MGLSQISEQNLLVEDDSSEAASSSSSNESNQLKSAQICLGQQTGKPTSEVLPRDLEIEEEKKEAPEIVCLDEFDQWEEIDITDGVDEEPHNLPATSLFERSV